MKVLKSLLILLPLLISGCGTSSSDNSNNKSSVGESIDIGGDISISVPSNVATYYRGVNFSLRNAELKTSLYSTINSHTSLSYNYLWTAFKTTDKASNGKVWDMYSNQTFTFGSDQCKSTSPTREGDCYNREHSFPKNWFNGKEGDPMYTDLHHLIPTDGFVNGKRSNLPFGEVGVETADFTSGNGSKVGRAAPGLGTSMIMFEPVDSYKGDFARIYFYMVTAYQPRFTKISAPNFVSNTYPTLSKWSIKMFLRWSKEDPVSSKEINRNNAVYSIQKNRNPFVDIPGLEKAIWHE